MESIKILYRVENDISEGNDIFNCMLIQIEKNKELLLIDIINYLIQWTNLTSNFTFRVDLGNENFLDIESPTSVIPVSNGFVHLILKEASCPPIVPIGQAREFIQKSRLDIYNNYTRAAPVQITKKQPNPVKMFSTNSKSKSVSDSNNQDISSSKKTTAASHSETASIIGAKKLTPKEVKENSKKFNPSSNSNSESFRSENRYSDYSDDPDNYRENKTYHRPARGTEKSDAINDAFFSAAELGSSIADVAGEAAKATADAAAAAAGSLFSFAAKSLQVASDFGSSLGSNSSSSIQLGKRKITISKELAEGGFGKVFLVQDDSGQYFAVKQMFCQSTEQEADAHDELNALQRFSGQPHIIQLIDHSSTSKRNASSASSGLTSFFTGSTNEPKSNILREVCFLFPLYESGTAWDAIARALANDSKPWPYNERKILFIILGIAKALKVIHSSGFSHRDIKPHNILIDDPSNSLMNKFGKDYIHPVLMDFGSINKARMEIRNRKDSLAAEDEAAIKTSAAFRPPELTQVPAQISIDERVDIWGLGCTMYCLAFGWSPFESAAEGIKRLAILNGRFSFPDMYVLTSNGSKNVKNRDCNFSQNFCDMITDMLQVSHTKRPYAEDVIARCEKFLSISSPAQTSASNQSKTSSNNSNPTKFKFPEQTFDRKEIDRALDRGYR